MVSLCILGALLDMVLLLVLVAYFLAHGTIAGSGCVFFGTWFYAGFVGIGLDGMYWIWLRETRCGNCEVWLLSYLCYLPASGCVDEPDYLNYCCEAIFHWPQSLISTRRS